MFNALVVQDDQKLSLSYCSFLERQGYNAIAAQTVAEAFEFLESNRIDIVLCDLVINGSDGSGLIHAIRQSSPEMPIMVLTALGDFQSKQRAYSMDVDDYMVKPIDLNEMALRMSAILRRAHSVSKRRLIVGNAVLDTDTLTVVEGSEVTTLPLKEFMILFKLCSSPGRIFSRRDIMDDVWGIRAESGERTVDVHIKRLRKRFESSRSFTIETVRGVGYRASVCPRD